MFWEQDLGYYFMSKIYNRVYMSDSSRSRKFYSCLKTDAYFIQSQSGNETKQDSAITVVWITIFESDGNCRDVNLK